MIKHARIGRRLRITGVLAATILLVAGCPLPFQFAPDDASGTVVASNDPANPLVSAAPTLRIVETVSGQETDDTSPPVDVNIFFESETRSATIFYRTDGQPPEPGVTGTSRYRTDTPVRLVGHGSGADIRAVAIGPGMYPSLVTEQTVTVTYSRLSAPTFSPDPAIYDTPQSVAISGPPGASIYYTVVEGAGPAPDPAPGQSGTLEYSGPITISGDGTQRSIAAIAVQNERLDSAVSRGTWGIALAVEPVTFTPDAESQSLFAVISLATATPDATIYYTRDGSDPSDASNPTRIGYQTPFLVTQSLTVRASAEKAGYNPAPVTTKTYAIVGTSLYDDFEDGSLDADLWTVSTGAFGRFVESDVFEIAPNQGSNDGNGTANVYGFQSTGGTGWARLNSTGAGGAWILTITGEQMGERAGGTQGWTIRAMDPVTGAAVDTIKHYNDTNIYQGANTPTNANFVTGGDSVGEYVLRKVETSIEVYLNGSLLRTVNASSIGPVFGLSVVSSNVFGVNVSYSAVAVDNVFVGQ